MCRFNNLIEIGVRWRFGRVGGGGVVGIDHVAVNVLAEKLFVEAAGDGELHEVFFD